MPDMLVLAETALTQSHIFTMHTLVYRLVQLNLSKLASITVIPELFTNFFMIYLLAMLVLFLFYFSDYIRWLLISA